MWKCLDVKWKCLDVKRKSWKAASISEVWEIQKNPGDFLVFKNS